MIHELRKALNAEHYPTGVDARKVILDIYRNPKASG
jgi:hypothetical protein